MRKIYSFTAAVLCTLSVAAGNYGMYEKSNRDVRREIRPATIEQASAVATPAETMALADNASASIVGKSYVVYYYDYYNDCNGALDVIADGDSIILGGLMYGLDVKAAYNAATGTITIPTGRVIYVSSTYGPITLWSLDAAGDAGTDPVIGTVDGNTIKFNLGICSTYVYNGNTYYYAYMANMKAEEANGTMVFDYGVYTYRIPLLVSKTSENTLGIVGISSFDYGIYYKVPVTLDATANTATISSKQPVDADTYDSPISYFLFAKTQNGEYVDPSFTVSTTGDSSVLKATTDLFYGYYDSSSKSYKGYALSNFRINVDFKINADNPTTGVSVVDADVDAPVEYYNIQGQKVAADNLIPGIYVKRQGVKATKVYVK